VLIPLEFVKSEDIKIDTAKFSSVSVILPAVNETGSFQKTVDVILATCNPEDIREFFIVLCDKSTPECIRTAESIRDAGHSVPAVIYYQQKPFIGMAIREAFDRVKGSHVVMMSTDLETDPGLVAKFIELEKLRPDGIVTASRWIKGGGFAGYSATKYVLNYIFQKLLSCLFFTSCTDLTYAYRMFPTNLVRSIRWEETKHPFFLETALKPLRLGVKFTEVPAVWEARTEGESQNSFFRNFAYFKPELKIRFMKKSMILKRTENNDDRNEK
jgi:glycosyltransferase involved in cell wall biosynthesis